MDAAVDRQAGVHPAERGGKSASITEPRCIEGNFGLPGLLHGARMEEIAFAEGRGPDPATKDSTIGVSGVEDDPLEIPR